VRVLHISVVIPPERDITPIGPLVKALRASSARPPSPPSLASPGESTPRQFGPMMRVPRKRANSTICATSPRGIRSVTTTISFDARLYRLEHASRVKAGGTATTDPSTRVLAGDLAHGVVHRNAVHIAPGTPGRDTAGDLGAVVEALRLMFTASRPVMP